MALRRRRLVVFVPGVVRARSGEGSTGFLGRGGAAVR